MDSLVKVKNAIISVSDKAGLVELAKELDEMKINIYSTGGTAKALENVGIPVLKYLIIQVSLRYLMVVLRVYIRRSMEVFLLVEIMKIIWNSLVIMILCLLIL